MGKHITAKEVVTEFQKPKHDEYILLKYLESIKSLPEKDFKDELISFKKEFFDEKNQKLAGNVKLKQLYHLYYPIIKETRNQYLGGRSG